MTDESKPDKENHGEGDREADRRYREGVRETIESGELEKESDKLRELSDADKRESRTAEETAKERAKEEDPGVRRDYTDRS